MYYIYFILFLVASAYAKTDAEYKTEIVKRIVGCTKDNPVDASALFNLERHIVPKKREEKCLLACAYRKEGMMNSKGLYDKTYANKVAQMLGDGDNKRYKNALKLAEICEKTNQVQVSDGEQGCDRAALIFKCTVENAPKYGFKI